MTFRTIAASALVVSALGYAGVFPLMPLIFFPQKLFPQIWRPLTAFLITGPGLGILLDPFFLFRYGSELERNSPRFTHPGDFFTYIMFVALLIVVSGAVPLGLQAFRSSYGRFFL
jgi:Derlin-2/3